MEFHKNLKDSLNDNTSIRIISALSESSAQKDCNGAKLDLKNSKMPNSTSSSTSLKILLLKK